MTDQQTPPTEEPMFAAIIRNTQTLETKRVRLPLAIDRQEAASMANRAADRLHATTGIFHRVADIIEATESDTP